MNNLAVQNEEGRGVSQNIVRARQLYEQAVKAGFTPAATNLARLLMSGKAGPPDPADACAWLLVAKSADPSAEDLSKKYCAALDGPALLAAQRHAADWQPNR